MGQRADAVPGYSGGGNLRGGGGGVALACPGLPRAGGRLGAMEGAAGRGGRHDGEAQVAGGEAGEQGREGAKCAGNGVELRGDGAAEEAGAGGP